MSGIEPEQTEAFLELQGIVVLLPDRFSAGAGFDVTAVDADGSFRVKPIPFPDSPAWQTGDLIPAIAAPPWLAAGDERWRPVERKSTVREHKVSVSIALRVAERFRASPASYQAARDHCAVIWRCFAQATFGFKRRDGELMSDIDRVVSATMTVYDVSPIVTTKNDSGESMLVPALAVNTPATRYLEREAPAVRQAIRDALAKAGTDPDWFHEIVAFGLLLHPDGIAWVPLPTMLGARGDRTELERDREVALEAPLESHRAGDKVLWAWRREHGFKRHMRRTGPKRGSRKTVTDDRGAYEQYLLERARRNVSPEFIAEAAEAIRLYRIWKGDEQDDSIRLDVRDVRYALKKIQADRDRTDSA